MGIAGYGSGTNNGTDPLTGLPISGTRSTDPATGKTVDPSSSGTKDYENNPTPNALGGEGSQTYDDFGKQRVADLLNSSSGVSQAYTVADTNGRTADYKNAMNAANARQAPATDYTNANQSRELGMGAAGSQADATSLYAAAARGQGPSAAQSQFAQALSQSQAAQAAQAASARGGGLARSSATQQAMNNSSQMSQQAAAASASLRAQEMQSAMSGYAGASAQQHQSYLGQQSLDAQQAQYNQGAAFANRNANDQLAQANQAQLTALQTQNYQGQLAKQQAIENASTQDQNQQSINNGQAAREQQQTNSLIAGVGTAVGGIVGTAIAPGAGTVAGAALGNAAGNAASDKRLKKDISRTPPKEFDSFLDALKASNYKYKNPNQKFTSPGDHTSVMAQDLEKSKLGRQIVKETSNGDKVVDYTEGFATMLAAMANMNDEIKGALASRAKRKKAA